jgi:hypothetical protein
MDYSSFRVGDKIVFDIVDRSGKKVADGKATVTNVGPNRLLYTPENPLAYGTVPKHDSIRKAEASK